MTELERADEAAVSLARAYALLGIVSIVLRPANDCLRIICPQADTEALCVLLRQALKTLEAPTVH